MSDLREALESAFDKDEDAVTDNNTVVNEPDTSLTTEPQPREDDGKFATKNEEAPKDEPVASTPVEQAEIKPPSSWKPEAKEAFIKAERGEALTPQEIKILTAEAQRREGDFFKGVEEFKTHAQKARAYESAIAPYRQTIQSMGMDEPAAIAALLQADHTLRYSDPATKAQYLAQLAQQYGVDLGQVQAPQPVDPQVQYLQQQMSALRQQQMLWQNSIQQQEQAKAHQELEGFSGSGKTHFEAVRNDMADLLESGKAASLEQAYEMAIWMRPDIRQTLVEQQRIEAQKQYEEKQRLTRAKSASVSVRGSSPSSSGTQPVTGDLRSILESQFAQ